ncbi:class I SAM-dependent methyltransferase [Falsiroseomonas sp. CW058]|uniref:class I SAM-dependent methyltransferase n=1 Tax=Falsiroseomonas sp. CW058 TaxID=3388664 RepID=UPI003D31E73C
MDPARQAPHARTLARILDSIEDRFATLGASPQGLWWPNARDLALRYEVMLRPLLDAQPAQRPTLLDFGCGAGFLPDWLAANGLLDRVDYTGIDISAPVLAAARARWPGLRFLQADILAAGVPAPLQGGRYDAVLACGIFTCRFANSHAEMLAYAEASLAALWRSTRHGLAFNAMSKHVDWEREDLLHWGADEVMRFCRAQLARHVEMRAAYGLWECSFHVWREARQPESRLPAAWRDVATA